MIIFGGSAGSLDVLLKMLPHFPRGDVAYVVVLHRRADVDHLLQALFQKRTTLEVVEVEDKEVIDRNTIYLAPPGYHLLFESRREFALDSSEKIHFSRPSIDATFESASEVFAEKTIAILLSGANADGAQGLLQVRRAGGITIAQDPTDAEVSYMPEQAIAINAQMHILK